MSVTSVTQEEVEVYRKLWDTLVGKIREYVVKLKELVPEVQKIEVDIDSSVWEGVAFVHVEGEESEDGLDPIDMRMKYGEEIGTIVEEIEYRCTELARTFAEAEGEIIKEPIPVIIEVY